MFPSNTPAKAMRGDDVTHLVAARNMGVQHRADVAVKFRGAALRFRFDLGAQIEAFFPVELNDGLAEWLLQALVTLKARDKVGAGIADAVGEAGGIERRLGGAGAGMGTGDESGIA